MNRPILLLALAAAAAAAPAAAQQPQPPAPGPLRPFVVPPVHEDRLDNGVRVVVVRNDRLPIVTGRILVDAGAVHEPARWSGLASLTGNLLNAGIPGMTAAQVSAEMERLGAEYGTSASYSLAQAWVTATPETFSEALGLAARTVIEPIFPENEFERARGQFVASAIQAQTTVEGLASQAFSRAVFEASAPYSRSPGGTPATLRSLGREAVLDWHRGMFSPARTTLLLVGDVTPEQGRRLAEATLGAWRAEAPPLPPVANPARPVSGTRVILIDRPGSVQSGIQVGQAAIGFADPSYLDLFALSHVLGGGFKARVNMLLRETHGWTYGAFSNLTALDGAGTFAVTSSVRTNATDSAVVEMVREYRRIAAEPVPEDELRNALANVVGSFPSSVETVQGLAQRIQSLLLYRMPLDYYGTYRERLAALTPADLTAVSARLLTPGALTIVVAGDLAQIEQPLRARNLGSVEVWDADGNRVR
jgi:zinc protease